MLYVAHQIKVAAAGISLPNFREMIASPLLLCRGGSNFKSFNSSTMPAGEGSVVCIGAG